jgi:hypothetical protein
MKITEGHLRLIIREELLNEAAITPIEAKDVHNLSFDVEKSPDRIEIFVYGKEYARLAAMSADAPQDPCLDAWAISTSWSWLKRLGPLLYDLMIDLVYPHPLAPDRYSVSRSARNVWNYYLERRSDIEWIQLDNLENELTPVEDDNCYQASAENWNGDTWPKSSLSKAYRRASGGTPVLDQFMKLGIIKIN